MDSIDNCSSPRALATTAGAAKRVEAVAAGATKTSESSALLADNVADRECDALEIQHPRGS